MKDRLFLLRPSFPDPAAGPGQFFCPGCMQVEGLLACFPHLREALEITYLDFPRPRHELVELLGADHQSCPVLVVGAAEGIECAALRPVNGMLIAADAAAIAAYLSARFGTPLPHP
jgi:hypothetical protein